MDDDDSGAETQSSIKEWVGVRCQVMRPNDFLTIPVYPKVAVQTYKAVTSSGYGAKRMFVDCGDYSVPHDCLKSVPDSFGLNPADATGFRYRVDGLSLSGRCSLLTCL
jgi:hypothetical protein